MNVQTEKRDEAYQARISSSPYRRTHVRRNDVEERYIAGNKNVYKKSIRHYTIRYLYLA